MIVGARCLVPVVYYCIVVNQWTVVVVPDVACKYSSAPYSSGLVVSESERRLFTRSEWAQMLFLVSGTQEYLQYDAARALSAAGIADSATNVPR